MIYDKNAIISINQKLKLQYLGFEQDWDIEMADYKRLEEFIAFFEKNILQNNEKFALIGLILASFDDLLNHLNTPHNAQLWDRISHIINEEKELYQELLEYWSLSKEKNQKEIFKITPLVREINK